MIKRYALFLALGPVLAWMLVWTALAYEPIQPLRPVTTLGQLGGSVKQVVLHEHAAYAVVGPRILTFDISDPTSPAMVAQTQPLDQIPDDLQIDGERLYAFARQTLLAFDIQSDGSLGSPVPLELPGYPHLVHDGVAYLFDQPASTSSYRLTFWDVSDLQHPRFLGDYENEWSIDSVKVFGQRMYLHLRRRGTVRESVLAIFDITHPGAPRYLSQLPLPDKEVGFHDLNVQGPRLFYLDSENLSIFDLSQETQPRLLGWMPVKADWIAAGGDGGLLLARRYQERLISIDVRNPNQPEQVWEDTLPGLLDSDQEGDLLAVAAQTHGLQTLSLADILHPQPVGESMPDLIWPLGMATQGDVAYVLDADALAVVDISHAQQPHVRRRLPLAEPGTAIHLRDPRLYVAAGESLLIYGIQSPLSPQLLRMVTFPHTIVDIASMGERLYVSTGEYGKGGLYALDLAGSSSPKMLIEKSLRFIDVAESQGRRFLYAVGWSNVYVYDITDEDALYLVGEASLEHLTYEPQVTDVHVRGGLLFLSTGEVVDVSDAAHPTLIQGSNYGRSPAAYPYHGLGQTVLWGSRHYLLSKALNVSDPALPYEEQSYPFAPSTMASLVMNERGILLAAAGEQGLWVLQSLPARPQNQFWEAEGGQVTPPMQVVRDAGACGGHYVEAPTSQGGAVDFTLDIEEGDDYYLWARVMGQDWHRNSFWVRFDDGEPFQFEIRPPDGQWHWTRVYPEHGSHEPVFLAAGTHTLRFAGREPNSRVDALFLTNHPDQHPHDAFPCRAPFTPTPTPSPTPTSPPFTPTPTSTPPPNVGFSRLGDIASDPFFHLTGPIAARDDILFAAQNEELFIYNTWFLPRSPMLYATLTLPGPITSLGVQGDFLFAQARGLAIIDISDLYHPHLVTHLPHLVGDIHLDGQRLYLFDGQTWTALDITEPATPVPLATFLLPLGEVQIAGNQAFILETRDAVGIYNLTDPTQVQKTGVYLLPSGDYSVNRITEMLAVGERLYLFSRSNDAATGGLTSWMRLHIVDVPVGQSPVPRGVFEKEGWARDHDYFFHGMAFTEENLFIGQIDTTTYCCGYGRSFYELLKFNVSDPDHPILVDTQEVEDSVVPILATSPRVWATLHGRLAAFDSARLEPLTIIRRDQAAQAVSSAGAMAYMWDGKRLYFIQNDAPRRPVALGTYRYNALTARLLNGRAYLGRHYGPPYDWDVPNQICVADLIQGPLAACHVAPVDSMTAVRVLPDPSGYIFLTTTEEDYAHPPRTWTYIVDARSLDYMNLVDKIELSPDAALLLPGSSPSVIWGINEDPFHHAIRIARLETPDVPLAELSVEGPIRDMALDGHILLILTDTSLQTVDLMSPEAPQPLATMPLTGAQGRAHRVQALPGWAYVAVGSQLRVINVVDPAHPREVRLYTAEDGVRDFRVQPPLVILAAGGAGMINLQEQTPPPILYLPLVHP